MSIEESAVVDFITFEESTHVVTLVISDHLDWTCEQEHIDLLVKKLNAYLAFIEGGQMDREYPASKERQVAIRLFGMHDLSSRGKRFIERAAAIIENAGFSLAFTKPDEMHRMEMQTRPIQRGTRPSSGG